MPLIYIISCFALTITLISRCDTNFAADHALLKFEQTTAGAVRQAPLQFSSKLYEMGFKITQVENPDSLSLVQNPSQFFRNQQQRQKVTYYEGDTCWVNDCALYFALRETQIQGPPDIRTIEIIGWAVVEGKIVHVDSYFERKTTSYLGRILRHFIT